MKECKTEIILSETVHLEHRQAAILDRLAARIEKENGFKPSRGLILRCLVECLPALSPRTRGIRSERSLRQALVLALDALKTGELET